MTINICSSGMTMKTFTDICYCGSNAHFNTRVTLLGQFALEELVQFCIEDTIGHELPPLGNRLSRCGRHDRDGKKGADLMKRGRCQERFRCMKLVGGAARLGFPSKGRSAETSRLLQCMVWTFTSFKSDLCDLPQDFRMQYTLRALFVVDRKLDCANFAT